MKRLIALILILSLVLTFTACGNDDKKENGKDNDLTIKNEQVLDEDSTGEKDVESNKGQAADDKDDTASKDGENKNPSTNNTSSIKPNTNTNIGTSNNGTSNKPANNSGSTNNSTNTGGNSNTGSSNNNPQTGGSNSGSTESEKPKEKTVTVKVPIYGETYREYWIKDDTGKIIFTTKDSKEWEHILSTPDNDIYYKASTYGSSGKNDIIGYKEYILTESEFNESNFSKRDDVTITWN